MSVDFIWIAQASDLAAICTQITNAERVAIDTEFIKVDTFFPILGVLQINAAGQIYLIDGHLDLTTIWQALFDHPCLIFHACGEDLDLIYHYAKRGPLTNIFDTQIALAFLGYGRQLSYRTALSALLHIDIEKDQTRSNWLARPLNPLQLQYAALDVAHLLDLGACLIDELQQRDWLDAVREDCKCYAQEVMPEPNLSLYYLDSAQAYHSAKQLMQLQRLYAWREHTSRTLNKPRSFLLRGRHIQHLVTKPPQNMWQLSNYYDIPPKTLRNYGKTILDLLHDLPDQDQWPQRIPRMPWLPGDLKPAIEHQLNQLAYEWQISRELLMRKKWITPWLQLTWQYRQQQDFTQRSHYKHALNSACIYWAGWRFKRVIVPLLSIVEAAYQVEYNMQHINQHIDSATE